VAETPHHGILSGGSVAICGASAALAISAVLPQTKENEKFTLLTVVGVTSLSTLAMIVYPLLVKLLGFDPTEAGVFIGGTIHDVAQVGAGYLVSNHTGDVAIFVKLTRVACLVPVVLGLSIMFKRKDGKSEVDAPPLVPFFLIGFVWLVITNSSGPDPAGSEWLDQQCLARLPRHRHRRPGREDLVPVAGLAGLASRDHAGDGDRVDRLLRRHRRPADALNASGPP
jgi:uncharacterized membrane protein YadS